MSIDFLLSMFVFALVASITPGPNNLMLMASGTNYGFIRTIPHMLGVGIGFTIMIILVGCGLMGLFESFPITALILKIFSVVYLVYLAWKIATATPKAINGDGIDDTTQDDTTSRPFTFLQAALFQWVNPKAWSMGVTAISIYTPPERPFWSVFVVAGVFCMVNFPVVSGWTLLGTQIRKLLGDPLKMRIFNGTAALLLIGSLYPIVKA